MKRILVLSAILLLVGVVTVTASTLHGTFEGDPIIRITKDGEDMAFHDVPAILYNNRTMVPVYLLRQLGLKVEWDQVEKTVDIVTKEPEAEQPMKRIITKAQLEELKKSVAYIEVLTEYGVPLYQGSGFIVNSRGLLITNHHVAYLDGKPANLKVEVNGRTYHTKGEELFSDELMDIFGVYLDGSDFEYLKVNDTIPERGDKVYVIGAPGGVKGQISEGFINSVYSRQRPVIHSFNSTVETAPGSSGSPVIDQYGEVIGIHHAGVDIASTAKSSIHIKELYEQSFNK